MSDARKYIVDEIKENVNYVTYSDFHALFERLNVDYVKHSDYLALEARLKEAEDAIYKTVKLGNKSDPYTEYHCDLYSAKYPKETK